MKIVEDKDVIPKKSDMEERYCMRFICPFCKEDGLERSFVFCPYCGGKLYWGNK